MKQFTYSIETDFPNAKVNPVLFEQEVGDSDITIALDGLTVAGDNNFVVDFKADLAAAEETTLSGIVSTHTGESVYEVESPKMSDGRPLVRSDTRPLGTQTYFTVYGDSASGIGDGAALAWDFSNDDDMYDPATVENGPPIPDGYKAKIVHISFNDPVYSKDGTIYFFDAPWGAHTSLYVTVPSGNYYPNDAGAIPAAALGLSGDQMYAYATHDVFYGCYVNKQRITGTCNFGDELNAEGSSIDPIPVGWYVTGLIFTTSDDNVSKGYGSVELYRARSVILPGGSV